MNVGSLFAGIGGFDLAAERCGMDVAWQSELDPHASRVLAHHWPDVLNHGDIHDLTAPSAVDVLTGGFPCQDYSVAGKGAGLAGDRGALWWQMHRVVAECRPTWVVGENVHGLTTSRHQDSLRTIIGSLVDLGYGVVWRVLDAQWFGVAQRRRRVFIVGHSGGQPRPEILALGQSVCGDSPPSRETGEGTAPTLAARTRGGGGLGTDTELDGGLIAEDVTTALTAKLAKGTGGPAGDEGRHLIAFNWQTGGHGMLSPRSTHTDSLHVGQTPAVAFQLRGRDGEPQAEVDPDGIVGALRGADGGSSRGRMVAFATTGLDNPRDDGQAPPLRCNVNGQGTGSGASVMIGGGSIVRRLTPLECERLQGFPDHWTATPGNSDSQRYKQLGNAVAVPVVEWILGNIAKAAA